VIEPTDEIQRAYAEAWFRAIGMDEPDVEQMVAAELRDPMPWRLAALRAVLAIVERDYAARHPCEDRFWVGKVCTKPHGHTPPHDWTNSPDGPS